MVDGSIELPVPGGRPGDGVTRRTMLATTAKLMAAASVGTLVLRGTATDAAAQSGLEAFMALSRRLTGKSDLDAALGARLHEALGVGMSRFQADVQALLAILDERVIELLQLQRTLDAEHSALAALPRRIVSAWYTGIVGEGDGARCIAFEAGLMNVVVADHLSPPSYCYGPPGSWSGKPA